LLLSQIPRVSLQFETGEQLGVRGIAAAGRQPLAINPIGRVKPRPLLHELVAGLSLLRKADILVSPALLGLRGRGRTIRR
jgi:hypothetical protein